MMSPPHREEVLPGVIAAARRVGLDPPLVAAVVQQESGFDPQARRGEDFGAALGLMGLSLDLARWVGYEGEPDGLLDPRTSLDLGTLYLRYLVERYQGDVTPRPGRVPRRAGPGGAGGIAGGRGLRGGHAAASAERLRPEVEAVAAGVPEEPSDFAPLFRFPLPVPHVNQVIVEGGRSEGWVNCGPGLRLHGGALQPPRAPLAGGDQAGGGGDARDALDGARLHQLRPDAQPRPAAGRPLPQHLPLGRRLRLPGRRAAGGGAGGQHGAGPSPVPHRGPAGPAAHFIVITGYDESSFFVNDPLNQGWHGVPAGPAHYTGASVRRACAVRQRAAETGRGGDGHRHRPPPPAGRAGQDGARTRGPWAGWTPTSSRRSSPSRTSSWRATWASWAPPSTWRRRSSAGPAWPTATGRRGARPSPASTRPRPRTGGQVVRQNFTAGIAEYDPQTGGVGWVEVVARPDALRSRVA